MGVRSDRQVVHGLPVRRAGTCPEDVPANLLLLGTHFPGLPLLAASIGPVPLLGISENPEETLRARAPAGAAQDPVARELALAVDEVNGRSHVVLVAVLKLAVGLVDIQHLSHCAVLVHQQPRADLELLPEDPVLLAAVTDQEDQLRVHLLENVLKRVPQGELAPSGRSKLPAAGLDNDHLAEVVAGAPLLAVRVPQDDVDVLSVLKSRHLTLVVDLNGQAP